MVLVGCVRDDARRGKQSEFANLPCQNGIVGSARCEILCNVLSFPGPIPTANPFNPVGYLEFCVFHSHGLLTHAESLDKWPAQVSHIPLDASSYRH